MRAIDRLGAMLGRLSGGRPAIRFGRGDPPGEAAETYARLLSEARRAAVRLNAENEAVARLEALAEGRGRPLVSRLARPLAACLAVSAFAVLVLSDRLPTGFRQGPLAAAFAGLLLHAVWCGDRAGLAWRRAHRARGAARLIEPVIVLSCGLQALLLGLVVEAALGWHGPALVAGAALTGALAGVLGSSGDPVADRIHGELAAARMAARTTEATVSRLEQALRTAQSADLASVSRIAPWPIDPLHANPWPADSDSTDHLPDDG